MDLCSRPTGVEHWQAQQLFREQERADRMKKLAHEYRVVMAQAAELIATGHPAEAKALLDRALSKLIMP